MGGRGWGMCYAATQLNTHTPHTRHTHATHTPHTRLTRHTPHTPHTPHTAHALAPRTERFVLLEVDIPRAALIRELGGRCAALSVGRDQGCLHLEVGRNKAVRGRHRLDRVGQCAGARLARPVDEVGDRELRVWGRVPVFLEREGGRLFELLCAPLGVKVGVGG